MGLFGQVVPPIKKVLDALLADTQLRELVTYKKFASQEYDTVLKRNVVTTTDYAAVKAIRLRHTNESVQVFTGKLEVGDQLFIFKFDDLPTGLSLKDRIVDESSKIHNAKSVDNIFDIAITVTVDGSGG